MKNESIWWKDINNLSFSCDSFIEEVDVLIIGGGITGLSCAYYLMNSFLKVCVFDKGKIGHGVTGNTTGKISFLQGDNYLKIKKALGEKKAYQYFLSQKEAISSLLSIISKHSISCDLEPVESILFSKTLKGSSKVKKIKKLFQKWGVSCNKISSGDIKDGFSVDGTYVFHPIRYLYGLCSILDGKVPIYENVMVHGIKSREGYYEVKTSRGIVKAKDVVVACHYPFFVYPGFLPFKTHVMVEYVSSSSFPPDKKAFLNVDSSLFSLRYYRNYLIYGSGERRLTSFLKDFSNYSKNQQSFNSYFHKKPEYFWRNYDVVSNDYLPMIGRVKPHLYFATGFNAWGMTNGTIAGKIIANQILGNDNEYESLFSLKRHSLFFYGNSLIHVFMYGKAFVEALLFSKRRKGQGLLCPHMKCFLVYNSVENTWDCPCHGSRFQEDGVLLEGPSKKNLF